MSSLPENTAKKQRAGCFRRGVSGNPAGRPKGARNRSTVAAEALLAGEAEALTRTAIEKAKAGDTVALRLCLERILPARRDRPVSVDLPKVEKAGDIVAAASAIAHAVGEGELTPAEGADLSRLFSNVAQIIDVRDLEDRLAALEARLAEKGDLK